jgi:hypothetical protein
VAGGSCGSFVSSFGCIGARLLVDGMGWCWRGVSDGMDVGTTGNGSDQA